MAKNTLATDYQDDILNSSMNGKRRYNLIQNSDGTVSLEDVSTYDQVGSNFGAGNINATNQAVNESLDKNKIIESLDDISAITESGYVPDALTLKEVNNSLGGLSFGYDETEQKYGYYKKEADTDVFVPFSNISNLKAVCGVVYYLNYPSGDYGYPILDYLTDYVTMTDYNRKYTVLKDFDALFIAELGDFSDSNTNTNCSILINDESILTITFANKKKHLSNICTISLKAGDVIEFSKNDTYIIGSVCCYTV